MTAFLLAGVLLLSACAAGPPPKEETPAPAAAAPATAATRKISAKEAMERIQAKEYDVLLDVRTGEEFAQQRIAGAVLLPDYEIATRAKDVLPDKDAVVLLYCRSGRRSAAAAKTLTNMGYTNVYDFGGIIDWPYETVSGPQ